MQRERPVNPRPPSVLRGALVALLALAGGCQPGREAETPTGWAILDDAQREQPVVYGLDNRLDVFETGNLTFRQVAVQSTAALVLATDLNTGDPNNVLPLGETLGQYLGLCPDERFGNQPTAAFCSGTLIADDLVLTAGHCIDTQGRCNQSRIVFDYLYPNAPGALGPISMANDVYFCAEILITEEDGDSDFAIIRLDRPVTGRVPAIIQPAAELDLGAPVTLIGYPTGIPAKVAEGGQVLDSGGPGAPAFFATVDAFGGNSGSGVFTEGGQQIGVLVAGQQDYVFDFDNGCTRVNVLDELEPPGETITYASPAVQALCATGFEHELCGGVQPFPGDTCADPFELPLSSLHILGGTLSGATNDYTGTCGGNGPEVVYSFEVPETSLVRIEASGFDTLLHVRTSCEAALTEVACDDDGGPGTSSRWEGVLQPGLHYLFMDAWGSNIQGGNYSVTINFDPAVCVDVCMPGAQQCTMNGNGFRVCEAGPEGCFAWSPPLPCGPGSTCQNGSCTAGCEDECPGPGLSICVDPGTFGECGFFDDDPCLDAQVTFCGPEELCLEQLGCTGCDLCEPGETRCAAFANFVEICEPDPNGCAIWAPAFPCEPDGFCSGGQCVSECFDECFPGDNFCGGPQVAFYCDDVDDDPCLEFVEDICDPGEVCEQTSCVPIGCEDECLLPSSSCSGPSVRTCVVGPDGCTELSPPTPCPNGGLCDPATGMCPEGCQNECSLGDAQCLGDATYRVCLDEDGDSCPEWTAARFCFGDTVCREGLCVLNEEPTDGGSATGDGGVYHFPSPRPPGRVKIAAPSMCANLEGDVALPGLMAFLALGGLARRRRP